MESKDTGLGVVYKLDPHESQIVKKKKPNLLEEGVNIITGDTKVGATVVVYLYGEICPDTDHKYRELEEFAEQEHFLIKELQPKKE